MLILKMILVILLITILILYYYDNSNIENYDIIIKNNNLDNCAKLCKETEGCLAFSYKDKENKCHLSENLLMDEETKASENMTICNKMFNSNNNNNETISFLDRKKNSLFICSKSKKQPIHYYHYNNKLNRIDEGLNIDNIVEVDEYKLNKHDWKNNDKCNYKKKCIKKDNNKKIRSICKIEE